MVAAFIIRKGCCGAHYTVFIVRTPPKKKQKNSMGNYYSLRSGFRVSYRTLWRKACCVGVILSCSSTVSRALGLDLGLSKSPKNWFPVGAIVNMIIFNPYWAVLLNI